MHTTKQQLVTLALTLFAALVILLFFQGAGFKVAATLAVLAAVILLWVLEPIPMPLTCLLVPVLLVTLGVASPENAFAGFGSASTFLILGGLILARGVELTKLGKRLTYYLVAKSGGSVPGILAALLLALLVTAVFMPGTAVRAVLILPIALGVVNSVRQSGIPADNVEKALFLGISHGSNITGMGFLPAALVNVIAVQLISDYLGSSIGYFTWLLAALPPAIALLPLIWFVLLKTFPPEINRLPQGTEPIKQALRELGPLDKREKRTLLILCLIVFLWMTESFHGLHPALPALLGVVLLGIPALGIATWEELVQINWGTVIQVGTVLSLGGIINSSGAAAFLAEQLLKLDFLGAVLAAPFGAPFAVALLTQILHLGIGNVATVTITLVPIIFQLAAHYGASPLVLGLVAANASLYGFLLAVETMPGVIAQGSSRLKPHDWLVSGLILTLLASLISAAAATWWWPLIGIH